MKWSRGCWGGLIVAIIAFCGAFQLIHPKSHGAGPVLYAIEVAIIALLVAVAAGIIGWVVAAWLLGERRKAKRDSS